MNEVFSFSVWPKDRPEWAETVNARTKGRAKFEYWNRLADAWPDVPFTEIRCRKLGGPHTSDRFKDCADYRGVPHIRCGSRVVVGPSRGVVVGHNSSACFNVLFDDDSPKYAGINLSVHPMEMKLEELK